MDKNLLLDCYRTMLLIRRFEDEAARCYTERHIGGFLHLYSGQEAVSTGVIKALDLQKDYIISGYRDHGHYLSAGGDPNAAMAELFGKATGCAGGRGGSMHFFDSSHHFLGGYGIVGAQLPIAAGVAFAAKYRNTDSVTVCFLGDGAVSIGPFHEALCLCALWNLPIIFVVENNRYSMGTPLSRTMVTEDASLRALGYPMEYDLVDSCDVVDIFNAATKAITRARTESKPTLLECKTYRYRGHSMADPGKYRSKEEVEQWKRQDPILLAQLRIEKDFSHLSPQLSNISQLIEQQINEALHFAHQSPEPSPNSLMDFTYV